MLGFARHCTSHTYSVVLTAEPDIARIRLGDDGGGRNPAIWAHLRQSHRPRFKAAARRVIGAHPVRSIRFRGTLASALHNFAAGPRHVPRTARDHFRACTAWLRFTWPLGGSQRPTTSKRWVRMERLTGSGNGRGRQRRPGPV